ncbi:hypothetical protein L914_03233, partial [Phytophthora nicotianae]
SNRLWCSFANQRDLPPFPGSRRKEVPPILLLQSAILDADQLLAETPAGAERRARGLRSSEDADVSEWRAFVEATFCQAIATKPRLSSGIACGASCCGQERGCWSAFGYPGPTRTSDSKLQKQQQADSALAEVMSQKEKVDNEGEPSDRNSNFGEQGDESAQEGEAMEDGSASSDTGEEQELASDRALSSESEEGSSGEKSSHRTQTSQAARTATNTNRSEESDEEDGAFLEGFSRRSD